MARFLYQARDGSGELATGMIQAPSVGEAGAILRAEGKFIVQISEVNEADLNLEPVSLEQRARRIKRDEVINFAHQLAVMIDTGVPISDALECIVEQTANENFRHVLGDVTTQVQAGNEFSAALRKYPKVFPPVMTSLVRASEVSGTMGRMLERVSSYMNKEQQTRRKIRGALAYPLFMMVMAIAVTIFLLAFVLPKFAKIYEGRGAALPIPTQMLITISNGLVDYWWLWVGGSVFAVVGSVVMMRTPTGRRTADYFKLNLPIIGSLYAKLYLTRACRTMGTMVSAGVTMLDMITIVRQVTDNVFYEDMWDEVDERLRQGAQLSDPLFASALVPRSISQMIYSGEKSGRLGPVMSKIAEFTEQEFDDAVKTTTQFIEPVMVALMGLIIGFVAISLLLPIFSVSTVVAGG
ncbi:MAG: type II secretion system F family protein [Phycisphaeraceae bacterium]